MSLLSLATIGLDVGEPVRELYKERGSAFSSATDDVAVIAKGHPASARVALPPQPTGMPETLAAISTDAPRVARLIAVPDSTGPPTFALLATQPARAPPFA